MITAPRSPSSRRSAGALVALALSLTLATPALAQVHGWLPVQGALYDAEGVPLDGAVTLHVTLWDGGGDAAVQLWQDDLEVDVDTGFFSAYLGQRSGGPLLDLGLFRDNPEVWLALAVEDDEPMARVPVAAAPFAAYAGDARTLEGNDVDALLDYEILSNVPASFPPAEHEHDGADITSGTLDPARFDAYASLSGAARLDGDDPADLLTRAAADARYLSVDAGGNANNLRTGIVDPDRYSAYNDLVAEGRLLLDDAEDVVSRARGDLRYAPMGHVHGASEINAGTLDLARFSAYDDLQAEGRTNGDVDTDLLLLGDARRDFAASDHTHSASELASGTLDTDRFDAYQDLAEAGRLNGNSGADLVTRNVGDGRYLREALAPAVGIVAVSGSTASTTPDTIDELTITVPSDGVLLVEVAGAYSLDADASSEVSIFREANLGLCESADNSASCGDSWTRVRYQDADGSLVGGVPFGPNHTVGFSLARVIEVSAGDVTLYLNGRVQFADSPLIVEAGTQAVATFFPRGLSLTSP